MIIFAHIPKTAGTSLAHSFEASCHRRVLFDYDLTYKNARLDPDEEKLFSAHKEFILQKFDYIHGHFYVSKYKKIFPDANYVTCFRHPVKRIISQYQHLYSWRSDRNSYAQAIQAGQLDVVEFAAQPNIGNAQIVHMDGYTLKDLDFFFLTEQLSSGVRMFNRIFRKGIPVPQILNTADERGPARLTFTDAQFKEIARAAKEDMAFYREAVRYYGKRRAAIWRRLKEVVSLAAGVNPSEGLAPVTWKASSEPAPADASSASA